jgi:tRNA(Ile)-lysidine synthase
VTAHHRDDQAETFLMRLARGAGVFGLAGMRVEIAAGPVTLVRPFLDVPRARLAATTAAAGLIPVDDPMNTDLRFQRSRVRRAMPLLASVGLDATRLAGMARRMGEAAIAIDAAATALLGSAVTTDALGIAALDTAAFASAPSDVRLRALTRLLLAVGGADYPPRFERLAGLAEAIRSHGGGARFKRTLGGVVVEARRGRLLFYREMGRAGLPTLALRAGSSGAWDNRFQVSVAADAQRGLTLGGLGETGRRGLDVRPAGVPAAAVAALPAIRRRGRLIAVPAVGWGEGEGVSGVRLTPVVARRLARPPLFPDFSLAE